MKRGSEEATLVTGSLTKSWWNFQNIVKKTLIEAEVDLRYVFYKL